MSKLQAQASPPASEGGVSSPASCSHRDGGGTRRRDGCAAGLTDRFNRPRALPGCLTEDSPLPTTIAIMNTRILTALFLSLFCSSLVAEEKVVRLYDGPAPGSENWKQEEKENRTNLWQTRVVFNVANPTLTVFPADPAKANGTAVVICPGGAFFALSIDSEGFDVARWLKAKGVTCFVLKYRLVECKTDDPTRELMTRGKLDDVVAPIVKLAMADGNAAVAYVRKHAKEYGVNPERIGIMGFSAGGTVTASVAFNYSPDSRPNFVAP